MREGSSSGDRMHEADIRTIVVETLAEQQRLHRGDLDAVVLKTIATILTSFGIEEEDRKDVCHGPVDDPEGGWGLSIFSAKDQTEVERLTAADPIILDDVGARYEILPMKQLRMKGAN